MVIKEFKIIDGLADEISEMMRGCELLEDIYLHSDDKVIPEDVYRKMRDFFRYDDSE
jgi:hypothetical protein